MTKVTEIATVPGIVSEGYGRICVFNGAVLVTNESQFFTFDGEKLNETQFTLDGKAIEPEQVTLYNFGPRCVMKIQSGAGTRLYRASNDRSLELLYMGGTVKNEVLLGGLAVFKVDDLSDHVVIDLTKEVTEAQLNIDEVQFDLG